MPYNGSGGFSLAQSAFLPNTVISSSEMNSDLSDIATNGLTNCITKDGQTTITAAFRGASGSVGLPMYSFSSDVDCGMYRISANNIGLSVNGTKIVDIATTGITVTGDVTADSLTIPATGAFSFVPAGIIFPYAGSSAPTGFLLCFGQSVLRADYPTLFTAIGITFGSADGTHFNLPDLRGRGIFGKDDMGGSSANRITLAGSNIGATFLGAIGGSQDHTITIAEMPTHNHTATSTDSGHTHLQKSDTMFNSGAAFNFSGGANSAAVGGSTQSGTANITTTIGNNGSGVATPIMPPTMILNFIIKT